MTCVRASHILENQLRIQVYLSMVGRKVRLRWSPRSLAEAAFKSGDLLKHTTSKASELLRSADTPPEVDLEDCPCPLGCAQDDELVLRTVRDRIHGLPGTFQIVRCRYCGLMRTNPRPTPATIGFYYPKDYSPYLPQDDDPTRVNADQTFMQRVIRSFFDERHTVIPEMPVGRALEIGCAAGAFLKRLRELGWQADGIEYSAEAAQHARSAGFSVHIGQIEHAPNPQHVYDFVAGWMVLEHLHEPVRSLKKLHQWTRPGAILALSVPDAGSWEMRTFAGHWYALHIPNHLYHFDRASLRKILEAGGWTMIESKNQRDLWPARASINYLVNDERALKAGARSALRGVNQLLIHGWAWRPLARVLAAIRQTGCMTVVAQRSDE